MASLDVAIQIVACRMAGSCWIRDAQCACSLGLYRVCNGCASCVRSHRTIPLSVYNHLIQSNRTEDLQTLKCRIILSVSCVWPVLNGSLAPWPTRDHIDG